MSWPYLYRALGHARTGNSAAATADYQRAEELIKEANSRHAWTWQDRVEMTVLQREVAELLKVKIVHAPEGAERFAVMPGAADPKP